MPTLLSPLSFAGLTLRNRIAMPPMWSGKATRGRPRDGRHHRVPPRARRGRHGARHRRALVRPPAGPASSTQLGVHDDACVDGLSRLAAAIRAEGAVACLQISHAGARASSRVTGLPVVAPSPVATRREAARTRRPS